MIYTRETIEDYLLGNNNESLETLKDNVKYANLFYNLIQKGIKDCKEINKITYLDYIDYNIGEWNIDSNELEHASSVKSNRFGLSFKLYFKKCPNIFRDGSNYNEDTVNRILNMYGINVESFYDQEDEEIIIVVRYTKIKRRIFTPGYEPKKPGKTGHKISKILKQKRSN